MLTQTNTPYKKEFDSEGNLLNPIETAYLNNFPNRSQRRFKVPRFHGNEKNYHLTVTPMEKYHRYMQLIVDKDGNKKTINHYQLV